MKNKPERISCILSILANRVGESISALASEIGVSDMTIRRDLHELSAQGYTTVINGVAILNDNQDGSKIKKDYFIHDERQSMSGSKEAIGLEACKLIEPNDIVLIDTGSTTECMLKHLNLDFPITVVGYTHYGCLPEQKQHLSHLRRRILPQEHRAFRFSRRSRAYIQTEYQQVLYGSSWSNFKRKPFMHRAV